MKKLLFILVVLTFTMSCRSFVNATQGVTETKLIKTVSINHNCPIESIKITNKVKNMAHATYAIEACGQKLIYKQLGTAFMEKSQADKTVEALKNPNN